MGENKKSASCLATYENSDHSSGNFCATATLFNLDWRVMFVSKNTENLSAKTTIHIYRKFRIIIQFHLATRTTSQDSSN